MYIYIYIHTVIYPRLPRAPQGARAALSRLNKYDNNVIMG